MQYAQPASPGIIKAAKTIPTVLDTSSAVAICAHEESLKLFQSKKQTSASSVFPFTEIACAIRSTGDQTRMTLF
jgi:hypothetical protein